MGSRSVKLWTVLALLSTLLTLSVAHHDSDKCKVSIEENPNHRPRVCPRNMILVNGACEEKIYCPSPRHPIIVCGLCNGASPCTVPDCAQTCSCPPHYVQVDGICERKIKCLDNQQVSINCGKCGTNPAAACTDNCDQVCVDCIRPQIAIADECVDRIVCPADQVPIKQCGLCQGDNTCTDDCVQKCAACPAPLIPVNNKCVEKKECPCDKIWTLTCGVCDGKLNCFDDCKQDCITCNKKTQIAMNNMCVAKINCPDGIINLDCPTPTTCTQVCEPCIEPQIPVNNECVNRRVCPSELFPVIDCGGDDCQQVCKDPPPGTVRMNGQYVPEIACTVGLDPAVICGSCGTTSPCTIPNCKQECRPECTTPGLFLFNGNCAHRYTCPVGKVPQLRCGFCDFDTSCRQNCKQFCVDCPRAHIAMDGKCVKEITCTGAGEQPDIVCGQCPSVPCAVPNCKQVCTLCTDPTTIAINGLCVPKRTNCVNSFPMKVCGLCNGLTICPNDCGLTQSCFPCPESQIEVNGVCRSLEVCPANQISKKVCGLCATAPDPATCTENCGLQCVACVTGLVKVNNKCDTQLKCPLPNQGATIKCGFCNVKNCGTDCQQICRKCTSTEVEINDRCVPKLVCPFPKTSDVTCVGTDCSQICKDPDCGSDSGAWSLNSCENVCVKGKIDCPIVPISVKACLCKAGFYWDPVAKVCTAVGNCVI